MQKKCSKCKIVKNISEFSKASKSKDGYNWECRECKSKRSRASEQTPEAKEKRKIYLKEYYKTHKKAIWNRNQEYKKRYPDKIMARQLLGQAVRLGYIKPPIPDKRWWDKLEFHHPDHTRPYFGCWVTPSDHRKIDRGSLECPECVDYIPEFIKNFKQKWQLLED